MKPSHSLIQNNFPLFKNRFYFFQAHDNHLYHFNRIMDRNHSFSIIVTLLKKRSFIISIPNPVNHISVHFPNHKSHNSFIKQGIILCTPEYTLEYLLLIWIHLTPSPRINSILQVIVLVIFACIYLKLHHNIHN